MPCRFRDEALGDDKAQWERKGEGIPQLKPDTETVQNINDHRYAHMTVLSGGTTSFIKFAPWPRHCHKGLIMEAPHTLQVSRRKFR